MRREKKFIFTKPFLQLEGISRKLADDTRLDWIYWKAGRLCRKVLTNERAVNGPRCDVQQGQMPGSAPGMGHLDVQTDWE